MNIYRLFLKFNVIVLMAFVLCSPNLFAMEGAAREEEHHEQPLLEQAPEQAIDNLGIAPPPAHQEHAGNGQEPAQAPAAPVDQDEAQPEQLDQALIAQQHIVPLADAFRQRHFTPNAQRFLMNQLMQALPFVPEAAYPHVMANLIYQAREHYYPVHTRIQHAPMDSNDAYPQMVLAGIAGIFPRPEGMAAQHPAPAQIDLRPFENTVINNQSWFVCHPKSTFSLGIASGVAIMLALMHFARG